MTLTILLRLTVFASALSRLIIGDVFGFPRRAADENAEDDDSAPDRIQSHSRTR